MAAVNKVILIGNLGRDPEIRKTPSGASVCSFSIATTEKFNDKNGQKQEQTEWHNVVAWNKAAEIIEQYVKKGDPIYLEGKLRTQSWDDNGNKKYRTEVIITNFQFLKAGGGVGGQGNRPIDNEPPMGYDDYANNAAGDFYGGN